MSELPPQPLAPSPYVPCDGDDDAVVASAGHRADRDALEVGDEARSGAVGVSAQAELPPRAAAPRVEVSGAVKRERVVVAGGYGLDVVKAVDERGDGSALVPLPDAQLPVAVASARHNDAVIGQEETVVLAEGAHANHASLQGGDGVRDVQRVEGLVTQLAELPVAPCENFCVGNVNGLAYDSLFRVIGSTFLFLVHSFCAIIVYNATWNSSAGPSLSSNHEPKRRSSKNVDA